jgi:hypothetical protein
MEFLRSTPARQGTFGPHHLGFMLGLGQLHAHFGLQVAFLPIEYGVDLEDELAHWRWFIQPESIASRNEKAGDTAGMTAV